MIRDMMLPGIGDYDPPEHEEYCDDYEEDDRSPGWDDPYDEW